MYIEFSYPSYLTLTFWGDTSYPIYVIPTFNCHINIHYIFSTFTITDVHLRIFRVQNKHKNQLTLRNLN